MKEMTYNRLDLHGG